MLVVGVVPVDEVGVPGPGLFVNADLILPVLADEILPVYRPDSVEANGSDA
jgi:hypothetical protein